LVVAFSLIFSSGLFVITTVKDREDKLRYLLNFAGISSLAYYWGIFMADLILFVIPTICIFILSAILQVDTFSNNWVSLVPVFFTFGISYIPLSYVTGFLFSNADTAFKYNRILMIIIAVITIIPYIWIDTFGKTLA
jgi:hypothetical protein